jgi:hypothetical protein
LDNNDEVVVVRGLGRHLELQELKKKQDEERRLREAEVFGINHKFAVNASQYDINNPNRYQLLTSSSTSHVINIKADTSYNTTVPKPFNLSSNTQFGQIRKTKMRELKEKEMSECTFKPVTNETKNKDII